MQQATAQPMRKCKVPRKPYLCVSNKSGSPPTNKPMSSRTTMRCQLNWQNLPDLSWQASANPSAHLSAPDSQPQANSKHSAFVPKVFWTVSIQIRKQESRLTILPGRNANPSSTVLRSVVVPLKCDRYSSLNPYPQTLEQCAQTSEQQQGNDQFTNYRCLKDMQ